TGDSRIPGLLMSQNALHSANVDLTVERCLKGRVDPAFRNTIEVAFAQGHVDDVEAVIAGRPHNLPPEPESGQHTFRVLVGSPADKGDHAGCRSCLKGFGAQTNSGLLY